MITSCLDFVNSIGYDNFKSSVANYFDHMMAFYRLCGACDFSSVSSSINDNSVVFLILFANSKDSYTLEYILRNSTNKSIEVFGKQFIYNTRVIDDNTLEVTITSYTI